MDDAQKTFSSLLNWGRDPEAPVDTASQIRDELVILMKATTINQRTRLDLRLNCGNKDEASATCINYSNFSHELRRALKTWGRRGRRKKDQQPLFELERFSSFWQQLTKIDVAGVVVAALLKRLFEMERDRVDNRDLVKRVGGSKPLCRSWSVAMDHNKDGRIQAEGAVPMTRTFKFPSIQVGASYYIKTSMRAAILNTVLIMALFFTVDVKDEAVHAILNKFDKRVEDDRKAEEKKNQKKTEKDVEDKDGTPPAPDAQPPPPAKVEPSKPTWTTVVLQILKWGSLEGHSIMIPPLLAHCAAFMSSEVSASDNSLLCIELSPPTSSNILLRAVRRSLQYISLLTGFAAETQHALAATIQLIERDMKTVFTPAHELQINCLFFMVRQFLSLHVADEDLLRQWRSSISTFMQWPPPVGLHARDAVRLLIREMKAPGYALRKRWLQSDKRLLIPYDHSGIIKIEPLEPLNIIFNPTCPSSFAFQSLLDTERQDIVSEQLEPSRMKQIMILQILIASGVEFDEKLWKKVPKTSIAIIFEAFQAIMQDAQNVIKVSEANTLMKSRVIEVWNELINAEHIQILVPKEELASSSEAPSIDNFMNRSTPMRYRLIIEEDMTWRPMASEVLEMENQQRPILPSFAPRFTKTGGEELLKTFISKHGVNLEDEVFLKREADIEEPRTTIKVTLAGGDGTLQYILLGYIDMYYSSQYRILMDKLDFNFYLLPLGDVNVLATYIAQRDLWYDTTIYRPLTDSLPYIPYIGSSEANVLELPIYHGMAWKIQSHGDTSVLPKVLLSQQVENYYLEAEYKLSIVVFNCEAWYRDTQANKNFYTTIPFIGRVELGLPAALAAGTHQAELVSPYCVPRKPVISLSSKHLYNSDALDTLKPIFSLSVTLIFYPLDFDGRELPLQTIHGHFSAVLAINVPRPSERRLGCDPRTDVLELCFMETEIQSTRRCRVLDDITNWLNTYHTKQVIIQAKDFSKPFHTLVDGEVYGPFYRLRLSALPHPTNRTKNLEISVMTYWPTHASRTST